LGFPKNPNKAAAVFLVPECMRLLASDEFTGKRLLASDDETVLKLALER
jgi:hypothetical protein